MPRRADVLPCSRLIVIYAVAIIVFKYACVIFPRCEITEGDAPVHYGFSSDDGIRSVYKAPRMLKHRVGEIGYVEGEGTIILLRFSLKLMLGRVGMQPVDA